MALPLLATGIAVVVGLLLWPERTHWILAGTGLSMAVAGKLIVLGGFFPECPLRAWELALLVIWMDLLAGFVWVYNMDLLFRVPWLGLRFRRIRIKARRRLRGQPWLRRKAFLGIVLFVLFPLAGTGAVGASVLGGVLGMRRVVTMLAIFSGAVLGSGGLVVLGEFVGVALAQALGPGSVASWVMGGFVTALLLAVALGLKWPGNRTAVLYREH